MAYRCDVCGEKDRGSGCACDRPTYCDECGGEVNSGPLERRIQELESAARVVTDWYGENTPGTNWPPGMKELKHLIGESS